MPTKSIRPLASLAEINTLGGSVTMKSHFFMNCGQVGMIKVREIACMSCDECRVFRYPRCAKTRFCGPLLCQEVRQKSGARDSAIETRHCSAIQQAGRERAVQVLPGTMVGAECTDEAEPYIVSLALTVEKTWEGEPKSSWMGAIVAGHNYWLILSVCDYMRLGVRVVCNYNCRLMYVHDQVTSTLWLGN